MTDVQIFQNPQFGEIRTTQINGEPWFVAADVCHALEIRNPSDALGRLDEEECTLVLIEGSSNGLPMNVITESGLYSLVLGSRKKEAKDFKRWITHEVLPAIRKTGTYSRPMSNLEVMRNMLDAQIQSDKRIERLESKVETALEKPVTVDWCKWANEKINGIVKTNGFNHQTYRGDLYTELEQTARCNVKVRQTRLRQRMRNAGHKYSECQAVSKLSVVDADPKLRAIFETIILRESAKYAA